MQPKTIFISHSTTNDTQVDRIAETLERAGFNVWVDHRSGIKQGTPSWDNAIRKAIVGADIGLFIMSEASLASNICGSECLLVRELGRPLYVLKLETVKPENIWLYIKQIQYGDLTKQYDAALDALIATLNGQEVKDSPQPILSKFTGEATLRQYLPYLFTNPMHGRDADLRRLTDSLNGVVQVTGTGGLGKSRLVAEVALKHPQGAVWYRCSAASSTADLFGLLVEHLQLAKETTEQDMLQQLRLRPHTLIVIDNAESVPLDKQPAYREMIAKLQASQAHVVLTSRQRWERLVPFKEITPTALNIETATAIARDFAVSQDASLTDEQAKRLAESARLYPRLIEWAIGQLNKRPFERVLAQLQDLKSKGIQDALEEMIRSSIQQMTAQEGDSAERLLRQLTVFQGTFDQSALQALLPEDMDIDDGEAALDTLQSWRFVRYDPREERYSVDAMVLLSLPAPDDKVRHAHFDYYYSLHSDYDANQAYNDKGEMAHHASLSLDWDNIQSSLVWGLTHEPQSAVDWVNALQAFMMLQRTPEERSSLLFSARVTAQQNAYISGEANCLSALGDVHLQKHEYVEAVGRYEEALRLYRTIGDRQGEAHCLRRLGDVHYMRDEYEEAVGRYEEALRLYRTIGDRVGEAHCLSALGEVHLQKNEYVEAGGRYEAALRLYRTIGARQGEAKCLRALGEVHRMKREDVEAVGRYEEALRLYRTIGARQGEAHCLSALGDVHYMRDEYVEAVGRYEEALQLGQTTGDFPSQLNCLRGLAFTYHAQNQLENACLYANQLLSLAESHAFFKDHSLVRDLRETFASWGCI